jgi:hypothetical protein
LNEVCFAADVRGLAKAIAEGSIQEVAYRSRPLPDVASRSCKDGAPIANWSVMPRGGHFAAMEQPGAVAG